MLSGLVFDIQHFSIHDGPGIRTTVFMKGCPMRCSWCHNPESQEFGVESMPVRREVDGVRIERQLAVGSWRLAGEVFEEIAKDEVFYTESGGGVTFSGGEPLMQPEFLEEMLKLCTNKGYHTAIDTCGHAPPAVVGRIMDFSDLWLYDLKLMDDAKHVEYTGVSNELALENLETLARRGKEVIIRLPVIPGITDTPENTAAISKIMTRLHLKRISILPYHAIARDKYRRFHREYLLEGLREPEKNELEKIRDFFINEGMEADIH